MAVGQQLSARWQVVQVLGEEELKATTVNVIAAKIDPKTANSLIRELNLKAPLPSLGHVKRVQRSKQEGTLDLSIILCTDDRVALGGEIVLPSQASEIAARYCLQPYMATVSGQPPRTREEWEMQCQLWPTSFHPNSGKSGATGEISQADAENMIYFMEKAIELARQARRLGQFANGAIIVDPALNEVIARGCDGTASWCGSLWTGSQSSSLCQGEEPERPSYAGWHPLQHAIMDAIQIAADRDRRLWPAKFSKAAECNNGCSSLLSHKRRRSFEETETDGTMGVANLTLPPQQLEVPGEEASSFDISRPYLCTNFDLYVTREPCTMYRHFTFFVCNGYGPPENTKGHIRNSKCPCWCSRKSIQITWSAQLESSLYSISDICQRNRPFVARLWPMECAYWLSPQNLQSSKEEKLVASSFRDACRYTFLAFEVLEKHEKQVYPGEQQNKTRLEQFLGHKMRKWTCYESSVRFGDKQ